MQAADDAGVMIGALTVLLWLVAVPAGAQPAAAPADELIAIWSAELKFPPALEGELTVAREGEVWRAKISGSEVSFRPEGESIRFAFPGAGEFRGTFGAGQRSIDGFWVRPSSVDAERPDPVGSRQAFATPLVLARARAGVWRGVVRPLEERFTLHVKIYRNEEGALVAAFRNHDFNSNGGASLFRVAREGDKVSFTARPDETQPEILHTATLARSPDRLQISWPDVGRVVDLVRRTPEQAPKFFPRPPAAPPYVYQRPPATGDGWATARGRDAGIDEAALARVVQKIAAGDPAARRPSLIHSILVARKGKLVLEEYFFGWDRDTPHDMRSAGKTFSSVLLGAAMLSGAKIAPESKIYELLAPMGPFANPDPRKSKITLIHLMTHSPGLACNDNDDNSPGNEDTLQRQTAQPNWWKYTLDLPMAHEPGQRYAYCSANINLMGAALTAATGAWVPEQFERAVARPLDFGQYHWNLMPTGEGYFGGGSWLRPRDLLKVGQAYLAGGVWRGRRIVAADWVKRSTAPQIKITPATTGLSAEAFSESYGEGEDAMAWHLGVMKSPKRDYVQYAASGNGGQLLIVVPELEMVVVFTGANYRQGGICGRWGNELIGAEIVPAMR